MANDVLGQIAELAKGSGTMQAYIKELYFKWNPCYIAVLPDSVLARIFKQVDMKTANKCVLTCRSWKSSMYSVLGMKPVSFSNGHADQIKSLPDELLLEFFEYLGTRDLVACMLVNKRWKTVLGSYPKVWTQKAELRGSLKRIGQQWMKLRHLTSKGKVKALSLHIPTSDNIYHFKPDTFRLFKQFPFATLREFSYVGHNKNRVRLDEKVWSTVVQCTNLKLLRFHSTINIYSTVCSSFPVQNSNLEHCRLEVLELTHDSSKEPLCQFDKGIFRLLSKAKVIRLDYGLVQADLKGILEASKDTLEELYLTEYQRNSPGSTRNNASEIELTKLEKFSGFCPTHIAMTAPRAATFIFDRSGPKQFERLLQRHHENVQTLSFKTVDKVDSALTVFYTMLFSLSNCRSLSLDLTENAYSGKGFIFWQAFTTMDPALAHGAITSEDRLLPKLQHLTIKSKALLYGDVLTSEALLHFVRRREELGLPLLESLVLIDCGIFGVEAVAALRSRVAHITFKHSQEP